MVADCVDVTGDVVMVNVAVVWLDATVTKEGICATNGLSALRSTTRPPVGAAAESRMFPVALFPPCTAPGFRVRLTSDGSPAGFTVSAADCDAAPDAAVMT